MNTQTARAASSFHRICGDEPLSLVGKGLYTLSFFREKLGARASVPGVPVTPWSPVLDSEKLTRVFGSRLEQFTSNRVLCSDFLVESGARFFHPRPRMVDLGCGPGEYSGWLRALFDYERYLGIDIVDFEKWRECARPDVQFRAAAVGTVPIDVTDYDSVFSISALEHVRYDKQILLDLTSRGNATLRHVHLIPGLPSFFQYKAHGYRRYNLDFVHCLVDVPGVSNVQVYSLGNDVTRACVRSTVGPTPLAQMQARKDELTPRDVRDAPFLALCFDQDIAAAP
jgi:hypothetical protein